MNPLADLMDEYLAARAAADACAAKWHALVEASNAESGPLWSKVNAAQARLLALLGPAPRPVILLQHRGTLYEVTGSGGSAIKARGAPIVTDGARS